MDFKSLAIIINLMKRVETSIEIYSPVSRVWEIATNIEKLPDVLSGIKSVDIIRKGSPLIGLKWIETRMFLGKEATEVMWIDDCKDLSYYKVKASSHGADYFTNFYFVEVDGSTILRVEFLANLKGISAKLMNLLFGWMFKGATIKAFLTDLRDIKKAAES